jgi:hypothetical protein
MVWITPFGHYYSADQIENNGRYFATDVSGFLVSLQERCDFRECNGEYIKALNYYHSKLLNEQTDKEYSNYLNIKPLDGILLKEDYLKVSKKSEVRELYSQCMDIISCLYNRYMSVVR